jgi:hypothetical protein
MNLFKKLKDERYKSKADNKLDYQKVFRLQEECSKLDLFVNVDTCKGFSGIDAYGGEQLPFFYEEGARISSIVTKKTYYFFQGNTCIEYHKSGYDRIIRIKVKKPESGWEIKMTNDGSHSHLNILNEYMDVYAWWDVDWLGFGKNNCDSCAKQGPWWKTVYDDVCMIYETVARKKSDSIFNEIYLEYERNKV